MTHLGQRLSALIDGELEAAERERVLLHMARCGSCRDEVAALRMLKRRMNALGDAAAGAALTGRLMGLGEAVLAGSQPAGGTGPVPPDPAAAAGLVGGGPDERAEQRAGRYFLAGSLVMFLAGLGTAAFIAGGEPQPSAPAAPVTPSVDILVIPHESPGNTAGFRQDIASRRRPGPSWSGTAPYATASPWLP